MEANRWRLHIVSSATPNNHSCHYVILPLGHQFFFASKWDSQSAAFFILIDLSPSSTMAVWRLDEVHFFDHPHKGHIYFYALPVICFSFVSWPCFAYTALSLRKTYWTLSSLRGRWKHFTIVLSMRNATIFDSHRQHHGSLFIQTYQPALFIGRLLN